MTISSTIRAYLKHKPYVVEALQNRIANSSALARQVQRELGLKPHTYNAVKAAIRRYSESLGKRRSTIEINALKVMKGGTVALIGRTAVVIASSKLRIENSAEVEIGRYYIYITNETNANSISREDRSKVVKIDTGCSAITIHSGSDIEEVPGIVAFLTSVLAEQGINIVEFISCYTETMIIVKKEDALLSYQTVSEIAK